MLEEIKKYLNISWDDEFLDKKIEELIRQSKSSINSLGGVNADFEKDLLAKELLFNRVRYAYNNSLEYFEQNFHQEILRWQLMKGVEQNAQDSTNEEN